VEEEAMTFDEWISEYGRAWREKDADGVVALFTEEAVYRSSPFRDPHPGHDGIRAYWRRATETQEDVDLRFGTPVVAGDRAAVERWAQMRSDGEEGTLPGILYLRLAPDGRCVELRETWHWEAGRVPPYEGWGE
jgi:ketosteroid isomerase-like protein